LPSAGTIVPFLDDDPAGGGNRHADTEQRAAPFVKETDITAIAGTVGIQVNGDDPGFKVTASISTQDLAGRQDCPGTDNIVFLGTGGTLGRTVPASETVATVAEIELNTVLQV
jgi:hypothetical protein